MARKLGFYVAPILIVLIMAPAGMAQAGARSAPAGACRSWVHKASPNVGTGDNNLYGVAAISASNAWAVGGYFVGASTVTLIEHWNGKSWSVVSSPNVGTGDLLYGVYAVSAADVWAAGSYFNGTAGQTLIEHWNGKFWSVVSSPNVGIGTNELFAIRGASSHSIWAVGDTVTSYPTSRTLILHWSGGHWRVVPSPSVGTGTNILSAVRPLSVTDAWAVGRDVRGSTSRTLILHWGGGHWRVVPSPNVGTRDNTLRGVRASSTADAWAVGNYYNGAVEKTLILHWSGRRWRVSSSPNAGTGSNDLNAIAGTSSTNAYAVGATFGGTSSKTLILHWDGSHWRVVVSGPNAGTGGNDLNAVFALSSTNIWAAGDYDNGSFNHTLVEHCR